MSAPSDSAASPSPCACTNISLMQLFHELKQKFPGVPDHVVSNTIELYCHDKRACETHLHSEIKASLTHAYHASSSAAARQLSKLRDNLPVKCRNQPIVKYEVAKTTTVESLACQGPQRAVITTNIEADYEKPQLKLNTDANQNVVESTQNETHNTLSPVTIINIDNCYAKYHAESPSDLELTNENNTQEYITQQDSILSDECKQNEIIQNVEQPESTNYRILKSNKVKANLNEKLSKKEVKEKKTIKKESQPDSPQEKAPQEKPQRPNTLNFIKQNPEIAFKENLPPPQNIENCRTVSPAPSIQKPESKERKPDPYRPGYPLNLSVNVNCHMDISHGFGLEDYDSPRAITSVNLTVCTPTSNMASPVRDTRDEEGGFEGHVTVTVSPSTARPQQLRRRAPPPPQSSRIESPLPTRAAPEPPGQRKDNNLIERQKERLSRLASALAQEKGCLNQLNRETQILAASPPTPSAAQRLRDYVDRLRDECDTLAKRLEMRGSEPDDMGNFYSNIYTGQRPTASWQCHMCTFRNHPLLDKCEECDMPRIFVGTSPSMTHDSGFGSFRDRNRRGANIKSTDVTDAPISNLVGDYQAVNV